MELINKNKDFIHAVELIDKNQFNEAELILSKLIVDNPNQDILHFNLGVAYLRQNKVEDATQEFHKSVKIKPKAKYINSLIVSLGISEKFEAARKFIHMAMNNENKAFFEKQLAKINEIEQLSEYKTFAPNEDSTSADFNTFYSLVISDYKIVIKNPAIAGLYGSWLIEGFKKQFLPKKSLSFGEEFLKIAIKHFPSNKSYLYNLTQLLRIKGDKQGAFKIIEKLITIDASKRNKFMMGNCYYDLRKYELAINQYEEILDDEEKDPEILFNLGLCYRELGNFSRSLEIFDKYIIDFPEDGHGYLGKGVIQNKFKKFEDSKENLLIAKKLLPKHEMVSKNLSLTYYELGETEKGLKEQINYGGAISLKKDKENKDRLTIIYGESIGEI